MKKQLITIASVAMLAGVVTFSSCKKDDTTAPSLTITGGNAQSQSLPSTSGNGTYVYPTVTATDDVDGDLTTSVTYTGTVNANLKGTYTLTYTVSDAAGNSASQVVTVDIVNDAEAFAGNYNVHDTVPLLAAFNYNITVTTDDAVNNKIHFGHMAPALVGFADYQNNDGIYATVSGTSASSTVVLPSQTASPIGTDNSSHTFNGNGSVLVASPLTFNITYTDTDNTNSSTAAGCVVTYTHQ